MQLLKRGMKTEKETESVSFADIDIVKLGLVAWKHRSNENLNLKKRLIVGSFVASLAIVVF